MKNYTICEIRKDEIKLLKEFLYEAIFLPEGVTPPPRSILDQLELRIYREDFGLWMRTSRNILWCVSYREELMPKTDEEI